MSKKIILTGGGTAGHVTPNIALIPHLREAGYEIVYIGSYEGIEKRLISDFPEIPYHGIATGKFRRYLDLKNLTDPFRVIKGFAEAKKILKQEKPDVLFSKGGFVSVPVANKLSMPGATKVCCNFPETLKMLPEEKAVLTGSPIREELSSGNKIAALELCRFTVSKPVVMVIGGSLGAASINQAVRDSLDALLQDFQVVHICGKEKVDNLLLNVSGYKQFEYLKAELKDVFAMADVIISRAGANAICELLALKKPNLLIPLPAGQSRGDQLLNAASFESQGYSMVIQEENLTPELLVEKVQELYFTRQIYIDAMNSSMQMSSISSIMKLIQEAVG